ncbi:hypothetical protein [Corynebacterium freiburgense]|uniref:hypothetical protein n=1 Tax=Corynebacterium freiburgense TaxID=556548 RepID=UPI00047D87EF|nr:hypothetical protein [Corynebacterium freiburgense]WJZ01429.1 hypothetical protein CFREI_00595 [Corynebacterium freiburgense]
MEHGGLQGPKGQDEHWEQWPGETAETQAWQSNETMEFAPIPPTVAPVPQYHQQYQYEYQYPYEPPKKNHVRVMVSILVFTLFASIMVAASVYLFSNSNWMLTANKNNTNSRNDQTVTVTVTTESTATSSTNTSTSTSETTSSAEPTTEENPKPELLTDSGWEDDSVTHCSSSETLVFAGRDAKGDNITVCKEDSVLRYRSNVNNGTLDDTRVTLEGTIADGGNYVVNVPPSSIEIYAGYLEVYTRGKHSKTLEFTEWWAQ